MLWTGGWVERCFGLMVGLRDVLDWCSGGWVERCFGLVVGLRDALDWWLG